MVHDPNAAADPDSGIFGLNVEPRDAWLHLIPVPWDVTTSYGKGTSRGPEAILEASHQVDLFDLDSKTAALDGICMLPISKPILKLNRDMQAHAKKKNLKQVNGATSKMNTWVVETSRESLKAGKKVGVVGGDHSVPLGLIGALGERYESFGILHIDAHADLRKAFDGFVDSHASIMFNVLERVPHVKKIVQVGIRDLCDEEYQRIRGSAGRVQTYFDRDLQSALFSGKSWLKISDEIVSALPEHVYVSFDIDGLDPSLCPHTGTPVLGGLSGQQMIFLLSRLGESGKKVIGFDLCEVTPGSKGDEWDANVGARMLYRLCHLLHS